MTPGAKFLKLVELVQRMNMDIAALKERIRALENKQNTKQGTPEFDPITELFRGFKKD